MASPLPAELHRSLSDLRCQIERLHEQNCALLAKQGAIYAAASGGQPPPSGWSPFPGSEPFRSEGAEAVPERRIPSEEVVVNCIGRSKSAGETEADDVETLHLGVDFSLTASRTGGGWTANDPHLKSNYIAWIANDPPTVTVHTTHSGRTTPVEGQQRLKVSRPWKESGELHPSVQEDPGVETLAGSRLGLLGKPPDKDENEFLLDVREMLKGGVDIVAHPAHSLGLDALKGHWLEAFAKSPFFKGISLLAIAANTIYIGASADHQVKQSLQRVRGFPREENWRAPDIGFAVWFSVELLVRFFGEGGKVFCGEDCKWNVFDTFLVLNAVVELLVPGLSNFSFLRIFRVFRLVRVVRIVKTIKALRSLRTMMFALLNSLTCLMWAFVLIIIIMFVFGIIFEGGVASYFDEMDVANLNIQASERQKAEDIAAHFGDLYSTMVTLFSSITGGDDWMTYGAQLRRLKNGEMYFCLFSFYIGFCLVGMLNVVTGIFVDSAVCTRTEDEVVDSFKEDQRRTCEEVRRIFHDADTDGSGTLSIDELVAQMEDPWVKAYFSGLDIDPSEARIIFTLIDVDGNDEVSIDEFVDGTMKLKGGSKSIDMMALMYDQARFAVKFNRLCSVVEGELRDIKDVIDPYSKPTPRMFRSVEDALAMQRQYTRIRLKSCDWVPADDDIQNGKGVGGLRKSRTYIEKATSVLPAKVIARLFSGGSTSTAAGMFTGGSSGSGSSPTRKVGDSSTAKK